MLCTQELYMWPHVLKERWQEERTGSSSLNFFQAVFTRVIVESHQLLRACLLGSKRKLPPPASGPTWTSLELWSAIQGACSSLALCTYVIRVLCQVLEPTAFLVHPVLAAIAEMRCCPLQCNRQHMETCLNSARGLGPYHRS